MSLVTRLIDLVSDQIRVSDRVPVSDEVRGADEDRPGVAEERLAMAALLVHVARADGAIQPAERDQLMRVLESRFGVSAGAARRLLDRADDLDREVDDVAALIDMMGHSLDDASKRDLMAAAYRVAAADGPLLEFEDDLLWRLGRLFGFADDAIDAIRTGETGRAGA